MPSAQALTSSAPSSSLATAMDGVPGADSASTAAVIVAGELATDLVRSAVQATFPPPIHGLPDESADRAVAREEDSGPAAGAPFRPSAMRSWMAKKTAPPMMAALISRDLELMLFKFSPLATQARVRCQRPLFAVTESKRP